jgi:phosphonate transport system substrate-binding protein
VEKLLLLRNKLLDLLIVAALISLSACEPSGESPKVLRIGILPDQSQEELKNKFSPLFEHISGTLGMPYELVIPSDYDDLLAKFNGSKVDLAYFGGFTFLLAQKKSNAVPIVMRDVDARFVSHFVVRADETENSLAGYGKRRLAFGSRLSTSGHLMPRFHLREAGIEPESFFSSVSYSGAHDKTTYWVRDGKADVGVANGQIVDKMIEDGRIKPGELRILWTTPPYPDYVWVMRNNISRRLREKVLDAFLQLSINDETQARTLALVGANNFIPASIKDFEELSRIALEFGLMND